MPIKRTKVLRPLSHEHHHGLLLCWKIRQGLRKGVAPLRIKAYCDHFYSHHLLPHFHEEEQFLFPLLGNVHPFIKKARQQHLRLTRLFTKTDDELKAVMLIEEELERHIRFEERELFGEIQAVITPEQVTILGEQLAHESSNECENWLDEFWV